MRVAASRQSESAEYFKAMAAIHRIRLSVYPSFAPPSSARSHSSHPLLLPPACRNPLPLYTLTPPRSRSVEANESCHQSDGVFDEAINPGRSTNRLSRFQKQIGSPTLCHSCGLSVRPLPRGVCGFVWDFLAKKCTAVDSNVYPAETGICKLEVEYDGKQPDESGISFTLLASKCLHPSVRCPPCLLPRSRV